MKKLLIIIFAALLLIGLVSCSDGNMVDKLWIKLTSLFINETEVIDLKKYSSDSDNNVTLINSNWKESGLMVPQVIYSDGTTTYTCWVTSATSAYIEFGGKKAAVEF